MSTKNTTSKTSILVADQLELVSVGLKDLFASSDFEVCGYAQNGQEVLAWLKDNHADIVLIDVSLPGMDGIDTVRAVHQQYPEQILLAHSLLNEIEYINSMLIEGASGYLLKGADLAEFEKAISSILAGEQYLSEAAQAVVDAGYTYTDKRMGGEYVGLTDREREVIKRIALEKTNNEIADELFLSVETIRTYRKSLMTKLNVKTAAGLVKYAIDRRWV
jgi:DNA-binding NarL/FixJ family response regulator